MPKPRVYNKTFNCSETFPIRIDEEWYVTEGTRTVERWRVTGKRTKGFTVEIIEYEPPAE